MAKIKTKGVEVIPKKLTTGKYQTNGKLFMGRSYATRECDSMNNYQTFLFNRALFGLAVYSQEDIKKMHYDKRSRIIKVHKRAQAVINLWKQQIVNAKTNSMLKTLFPRSVYTEYFATVGDFTDPEFVNRLSFKSLGIRKSQVIEKLISSGVLPKDFDGLKPQEEIHD